MRASLVPRFVLEQRRAGRTSGQLHAAVLFLDITGFTALTERLQHQGVEGAEILGQLLADSFGPLVAEVDRQGGIIPLYAGDAFAAVFPGEPADAALRALAVCEALTERFGEEGLVLRSRLGTHRIQLTVGLGLGEVSWGVVDDGERATWYFRGPGIDHAVEAEAAARPGEPGGLDALERVSADAPSPSLVPVADREPTRAELLPFVGEALLRPELEAAFRPVWPVFISFEELDDAALHRWVAQVLTLARRVGLTFSQLDFGDKGGSLVLFAGAPRTLERGGDRALRFLEALGEVDGPRWRAGLTHGTHWAGFRGGAERLEYGVVGPGINLAARLCMLAPWGEVWVGPQAAELLGDRGLVDRGVHPVRGREPVRVRAVVSSGGRGGPRRRAVVGRRAELDALESELAATLDGLRRVVVEGDGGIGKTVLIEALEARDLAVGRPGFLRLEGDPLRIGSQGAILGLVGRLLGQEPGLDDRRAESAAWAAMDALEEALREAGADEGLREELTGLRSVLAWSVGIQDMASPAGRMSAAVRAKNQRRAVVRLLEAHVVLGRRVLWLEDGHWVDDASMELVEELAAICADRPLMLLATLRPREVEDPGPVATLRAHADKVLTLGPLDESAARALVRQALERPPVGSLVKRLLALSGGNPLFLEELALDLDARGLLVSEHGQAALGPAGRTAVPRSLSELLVARIDGLSAELRQVVQTAAVLGRDFDIRVLSGMVDREGLEDQVVEIERRRVWELGARGRYSFRHALIRDAAYAMQLRAHLRTQHALAAATLDRLHADDPQPPHAEIARHYRAAERPAEELEHTVRAVDQALADRSVPDVLRWIPRALELAEGDRERTLDLRVKRARLLVDIGRHDDAEKDLEHCRPLVGDEAWWQVDLSGLAADVAMRRSQFADVVKLTLASEAAAERVGREERLLAARYLRGVGLLRLGRYGEAQDLLEEVRDAARDQGQTDVYGNVLGTLGLILMERGDFAAARELHTQILEMEGAGARTELAATARVNLALCANNLGNFDKAWEHTSEAQSIFAELWMRHHQSVCLGNLSGIAAKQGRISQARELGLRSLRLKQELGDIRGEGYTWLALAEAWVQGRRYTDALAESRRATDRFEGIDNVHGRLVARLQQLEVHRRVLGEAEDPATALALETEELAERVQNRAAFEAVDQVLARGAWATGQLEGVAERLTLAEERGPSPGVVVRVLGAMALHGLGRPEEAQAVLDRADERAESVDDRLRVAVGRAHLGGGSSAHLERVADLLAEVDDVAVRLHAVRDVLLGLESGSEAHRHWVGVWQERSQAALSALSDERDRAWMARSPGLCLPDQGAA